MEQILQVSNLSKSFKEKKVLDQVSFHVVPGEVFCILGPNGAGKSTTINILASTLQSDAGEILFQKERIQNHMKHYKKSIGIVPQDISLYEELSAETNLRFFASLYGLRGRELDRAVDGALEFAELEGRRKDKVRTFSGGMKRRLNIACAIAHSPQMVIMDEPTVGIDPQSRNHILESIMRLKDEGMAVIYTTHYMEEVEAISSRIMIMDHGTIIAEGTRESLIAGIQDEKRYLIEFESEMQMEKDLLFAIEGVKTVEVKGRTLEVTVLKNIENLDRLIALLSDHQEKFMNITTETSSLETVFLRLTGRTLRD